MMKPKAIDTALFLTQLSQQCLIKIKTVASLAHFIHTLARLLKLFFERTVLGLVRYVRAS